MSRDKKKTAYMEALVELGRISSFDPTKLSRSTIESMTSHIKLLKHNQVPLTIENLTSDPVKLLDSLRDSKGNKLKPLYKIQIGATIKRMFPDATIDIKVYGKGREYKQPRAMSVNYMGSIKKLIDVASQVLRNVHDETRIDDTSLYDTAVTILFGTTTSLRISEILQLKLFHIDLIEQGKAIAIQSKARHVARVITPNETLVTLLDVIKRQREVIELSVQTSRTDSRNAIKLGRLKDHYIVLSSKSHIFRKLKELAAIHLIDFHSESVGFNAFRKYTTTLLVEGGEHDVARALNQHSDLDTTLRHYNIQSEQSAENAFKEMHKRVKASVPNEIITAHNIRMQYQGKREALKGRSDNEIAPVEAPPSLDVNDAAATAAKSAVTSPTISLKTSSTKTTITAAASSSSSSPPPPPLSPVPSLGASSLSRRQQRSRKRRRDQQIKRHKFSTVSTLTPLYEEEDESEETYDEENDTESFIERDRPPMRKHRRRMVSSTSPSPPILSPIHALEPLPPPPSATASEDKPSYFMAPLTPPPSVRIQQEDETIQQQRFTPSSTTMLDVRGRKTGGFFAEGFINDEDTQFD